MMTMHQPPTRTEMLQAVVNDSSQGRPFKITFANDAQDEDFEFKIKSDINDDIQISLEKGRTKRPLKRLPGSFTKFTSIDKTESGVEITYEFSGKSEKHHDYHDHKLVLIILDERKSTKSFFYYITEINSSPISENSAAVQKAETKSDKEIDEILTHQSTHGGGRG